ncbi:MAG: hypothetical protein ABIR96_07450, partial [Bdellovibrionota bacterium]
VAFTSSEPNAAYLLHFDSIWNGTAFGVATDAMGSNAGGDPTYVNGATSSYPILSGFSRSVAQIAGVANATNPKIMVATQLNQGNYSEVSALQGSTPSLALSRNLESVGLTLYHVENVNDVDVAIIQRDQNLVLIRR